MTVLSGKIIVAPRGPLIASGVSFVSCGKACVFGLSLAGATVCASDKAVETAEPLDECPAGDSDIDGEGSTVEIAEETMEETEGLDETAEDGETTISLLLMAGAAIAADATMRQYSKRVSNITRLQVRIRGKVSKGCLRPSAAEPEGLIYSLVCLLI